MQDLSDTIKQNSSILLSRNTPIALVVGAAGFLGSNLSEELLNKNIQVIGVDNFSTGKKENLEKAVMDKNFHLINIPAQNLAIDLPRLDYLFVVAGPNWNLSAVLDLAKERGAKTVFVSSIELYDRQVPKGLSWFKENEAKLAKFSSENKLNARVVRLSAIFGPKMHFRVDDPSLRLIQASLLGELQKESEALEFSSRALYVADAVNLIIKSMLSGSTALKIFDGALLHPIKVSEIKQVLLDPVWYENRGFEPTELPPWGTPNLEKTMKILNWKPHTGLVQALKETVAYFKDREIEVPKEVESELFSMEGGREEEVQSSEKKEELPVQKKEPVKEGKLGRGGMIKIPWGNILGLGALAVILYGLIYPLAILSWGVYSLKYNLTAATRAWSAGEYDQGLQLADLSKVSLAQSQEILASLEPLEGISPVKDRLTSFKNLLSAGELTAEAAHHGITGSVALISGLKIMGGSGEGNLSEIYANSLSELSVAESDLAKAKLNLTEGSSLFDMLTNLQTEVKKVRAAAILVPPVSGAGNPGDKKSYLVILQNNQNLRPAGGVVISYLKLDFEGGFLKAKEAADVSTIDAKLPLHVDPPKEIAADLGQRDWLLKDAMFEADFPTAARQADWFFTKETNSTVTGVLALDLDGVAKLLKVVGQINLSDYHQKISADNLLEKASAASASPSGSLGLSFYSQLLEELFNKLFFIPRDNWGGVAKGLEEGLTEKHLVFYLKDPQLFSYLVAQEWAGVLPRGAQNLSGEYSDFLAPVEANMGLNNVNFYVSRKYNLETSINKDGFIKQRLVIVYNNTSPSDKYKNRFKVYLPIGSKLDRALWGEEDITKQASGLADYGRAGYSMLLELRAKQTKILTLDYQPPKIEFKNGQVSYSLDLIKQAGTNSDKFDWRLTGIREQTIQSDLSQNRRFALQIKL